MCGESNPDRPQHPWQLCLQISKSLTMVKTHNALLSPSNPTMNQNAKENMSATRCSLIRHPQHYQHLYAAAFHLMSHSTCRNSTEEPRPVSSKFQPRETYTRSPGGLPHMGKWGGFPYEKGGHNTTHAVHVGKGNNAWGALIIPLMVKRGSSPHGNSGWE